ncbi:MAG TPA: P22 phage major capsid protein family protein, partial [Psychromonas sp.]
MANTLTNLVPDLYQALDTVSRELVGYIPSVTVDSGVERAAVGQTVRSFVAPASAAGNITPGVTPPDDGDQDIGNRNMTITKARRVPVRWNGEEQRGVQTGPGYSSILQNQFAQAMRTLCNEMEADLANLYTLTSRAYGTAGTTPFASDLSDTAQVRKILVDNGAPVSDMQLVIDTAAGAKMRTLTQLTKANEAADAS